MVFDCRKWWWWLHRSFQVYSKKNRKGPLGVNQGLFLHPNQGISMPLGYTHPPPPVPPFLLTQSRKWHIMKLKVSWWMQAPRGYIEVGDGVEQCLFKGSLSHLLKCLWLGWKMESSIQWDHQENRVNSEQWRSTPQIFLATNNRAPTAQ